MKKITFTVECNSKEIAQSIQDFISHNYSKEHAEVWVDIPLE